MNTQEVAHNSEQASRGWGLASLAPSTGPAQGEKLAETDISPEYPYASHYVEVFGSKMHYIDEGSGDSVLFLHGNATWSYIWRNIIPHMTPVARCIAADLMGFGKSDKPDVEYTWFDQARYVAEFIDRLGLKKVTLVLQDWGVGLGLYYAMRHESNVKALAFFEGIVKPFPAWSTFSTPAFRELIRQFRTGGVGGVGWKLVVDENVFVEKLLPGSAGRPLTEREMNTYRQPFEAPASRKPIWRFAQSAPIEGEPKEVWAAVSEYSERLQQSKLPKLLFHATPGAVIDKDIVEWCKRNLKNLQTVDVGAGVHYLQETSPHLIGRELAKWFSSLASK